MRTVVLNSMSFSCLNKEPSASKVLMTNQTEVKRATIDCTNEKHLNISYFQVLNSM